ncbi:probable G-protein coupled receptor 149 isoform X10 [Gallus gallus]|uniref:probable G-protein coupled receptor 149 isoform X10 n=1 Tax=Gallus gallus TaxID=9031 RepID=UPI001F013141|nr:probable G-protein coupled receptor 149 isoform X10 [Gallus gallus]
MVKDETQQVLQKKHCRPLRNACGLLMVFKEFGRRYGAALITAVLSVPLTYQLLCSDEQQLLHVNYQEISRGYITPGTPAGCSTATPCLSPVDPVDKTLKHFQNACLSSKAVFRKGVAESSGLEPRCMNNAKSRSFTVGFAQKRFSLILALTKVILWLPMMIQMVVQHITGYQSFSFETLSFLLTLLAATVTPVFVLSEHWIHLPCGCIINCRRNSYAVSSEELKTKHRGFEFNLSFQHGYGIYRISPESHHHDGDGKSTSCHNLLVCEKPYEPPRGGGGGAALAELSTTDSARPGPAGLSATDSARPGPAGFSTTDSARPSAAGVRGEAASGLGRTVEGPERRLSHEEGHKPELTDWEWCRSKSERTPRQGDPAASILSARFLCRRTMLSHSLARFFHAMKPIFLLMLFSEAVRWRLSYSSVCISRNRVTSGTHRKNSLLVYIRGLFEGDLKEPSSLLRHHSN